MLISGSFTHALNDGEVVVHFTVLTNDIKYYDLTDITMNDVSVIKIVHPEDYDFLYARIAEHTNDCVQDAWADVAEAKAEAKRDALYEEQCHAA